MKIHVFRLKPGELLREGIDAFVSSKKIKAGIILTCVGNLKKATLRLADSVTIKNLNDPGSYEIVSLVGTVESGNSHLHISLSDKTGKTIGGHLKNGAVVGITAEIAIGELENVVFKRDFDSETGYNELVVKKLK
jgi:predicted DNA-binding protein with PD1-like motif